jgi:hypothetical protein
MFNYFLYFFVFFKNKRITNDINKELIDKLVFFWLISNINILHIP